MAGRLSEGELSAAVLGTSIYNVTGGCLVGAGSACVMHTVWLVELPCVCGCVVHQQLQGMGGQGAAVLLFANNSTYPPRLCALLGWAHLQACPF